MTDSKQTIFENRCVNTMWLLISLQLLVLYANEGEGVDCHYCTNVPLPNICNQKLTCQPQESCFVEQIITTSGNILYNSGCESDTRCAVLNAGHTPTRRNSDIVVCRQCCQGSTCNYQGCGLHVETTPPAVFTTTTVTPPPSTDCDTTGGYTRIVLTNQDQFCVKVHEGRKNWHEAKDACQAENARLVVTNTAEKINELDTVLLGHSRHNYWIGLEDRYGNDTFYWITGEVLVASDWGTHPPQPTHVYNHGDEDCVYVYRTDYWHDTWCSHYEGYVCERV